MSKCDLDACSLKEHIEEIKDNQIKMIEGQAKRDISQGRFEQKLEDWMEQDVKDKKENGKQHDILFDRTRGMATWSGIFKAIGGTGGLMAIIYVVMRIAGGQ